MAIVFLARDLRHGRPVALKRSEAALLLTRNPVVGSAVHDPRMAELRARYGLPD